MIEIVAGAVSVVVGAVVRRRMRGRPRGPETILSLRHAGQVADAYRDANAEVAYTLDELRAALDAKGLPSELVHGDLVIRRGDEQLRVAISDPRRVTLASIDIHQSKCETLGFDVALALVPSFGAIRMTDALWGGFDIDGTQAADAYVGVRGERIAAMARGILEEQQGKAALWAQVGKLPLRSDK